MPQEDVLKRFDFGVNITKAWVNKETGKHYVKAIASDTGVDHHGERFSEKAIDGMVSCITKNDPAPVLLLPTHWDTFEIGKAVSAKSIKSPTHEDLQALEVEIELDMEYPQAKSLYKEVEGGNAKKQLSVGGYLNPDSDEAYFWEEKQYETEDGNILYDYLLVLNDLVLDHIAVTRNNHAANPRTGFSEAIAKSLSLEKPTSTRIKSKEGTEDKGMSNAEKQTESFMSSIRKSVGEFFKSTDVNHQQVEEAKTNLEKAKEALEALGENIPDEIKEQLKSLNTFKEEDPKEPQADPEPTTEPEPQGEPQGEPEPVVDPEPEAEKTSDKVDTQSLKSEIMNDITKSINDANKETFKEISESLGSVIAETIKSQVTPLQEKIAELEKLSGKSKSLSGQEGLDDKVSKSSKKDEEENLWDGIIKSAIPSHILQEKLYENEGGNE